ncbi:MAG: glycosyltransferase family 39 protein [Candidatus Shapirobacteria bacterium]|nr:glycosyltransferase family 39 protein [Candidatus Shapirobacteria bacterium]MDD3002463.1 glycosyltransferase family 39 protein [Candidatus Shapirobacteria bacterium]MDD4383348.1 glycosyltransferase family 39 protein [Candidatus Shapirobacteria bacterium]
MKKNYILSLVLLLFFSLFLYLYKNTTVPPSLYSDEADISYQAFIFNKYHTDYYGNKFPIHFHSYSDWQPSFFIYSVALTQKFIGHTDSSVRIPAAIFGVLTVLFFCLIIKLLLNSNIWSIIGGFLLAISPWLFHYSRTGFAVTNMLFLTLLGIYFWIKFIKNNQIKNLFISIISFSLLTYSYSTAKLHLIFIFLTLYLIWFKTINKISLKNKLMVIFLVILICLPIISDTLKGRAGYRFNYINIFSDPTVSKTVDNLRQEDSIMVYGQQIGIKTTFISKIFYNKVTQWLEMFTKNYFSAFSTDFLFLTGDENLRQGTQTTGNLFPIDFFLIITGISVFLLKKIPNSKFYLFFLLNLLLAPVPFALTRDSLYPHATRLILMLPFLIFFSILGLKQIFKITKSKFLIAFILFLYVICFGRFIHQYYFHYPNISAKNWHFGMKEATIKAVNTNFSKIYFINSESFIPFFLNYSEYLPVDNNKSPASLLISENNQFFTGMQTENKYYLGHMEWSPLLKNIPPGSVFIVPELELIRLKLSIEDYNKNNTTSISLNQTDGVKQIYSNQEKIYLVNLNFNK